MDEILNEACLLGGKLKKRRLIRKLRERKRGGIVRVGLQNRFEKKVVRNECHGGEVGGSTGQEDNVHIIRAAISANFANNNAAREIHCRGIDENVGFNRVEERAHFGRQCGVDIFRVGVCEMLHQLFLLY